MHMNANHSTKADRRNRIGQRVRAHPAHTPPICMSIETIMFSFHTNARFKGKMLQNAAGTMGKEANCYSSLIVSVCGVHKYKMKHALM